MNKKKKIIMITISIIIIVLLLAISFTGSNKSQDKNNFNSNNSVDNNIENEIIANDDSKTIEDTNTNEKNVENNSPIVEETKNIVTEDTGTLPSDAGLTVSGVSKTFNQDIISQANIAYLLGCENILETTNFEDYINKNITKNGIFISNVSGYTKTDNPYDFIKENTVFMKELLSAIGFSYDIENNYYPIATKADGTDEVYVGRIRRDFSVNYGINFWVVSDNLSKGAASNAVQILEKLIS